MAEQPSLQQLESALIKADKAGDQTAARAIAADMTRLQQPTAQELAFKSAQEKNTFLGNLAHQAGQKLGLGAVSEKFQSAPGMAPSEELLQSVPVRIAAAGGKQVLGAVQLLSDVLLGGDVAKQNPGSIRNILSRMAERTGIAKEDQDIIANVIKNYDSQRDAAMAKARGKKEPGFDFAGLLGSILNPISLKAVKLFPIQGSVLQRIPKSAALGAGLSVLTPETSTENMAGKKLGKVALGASVGAVLPFRSGPGLTKEQNAVLKELGDAGYVVPRGDLKKGAVINVLGRFGGKEGIESVAREKSQAVSNRLAARWLKQADDTTITPELLGTLRQEAGKSYDIVSHVGMMTADKAYAQGLREVLKKYAGVSKDFPGLGGEPVKKLVEGLKQENISSQGAVETIKFLRKLSRDTWSKDQLLSKAQRESANLLEDLIERNIAPTLGKEILRNFRAAREMFAKTDVVQKALNPSTFNISAREFVKQAGKRKLTGEGELIATFGRRFPRIAGENLSQAAPGGLLEPLVYSAAGGVAAGPPGIAATGIPLLKGPARSLAVTKAAPVEYKNRIVPALAFGINAFRQERQ